MHLSSLKKLSLALAGVLFTTGLQAQLNPAATQADMQRQREELEDTIRKARERTQTSSEIAPELFLGEFEDVGPQEVLKQKRRKRWVNVTLDSQFFHTSNSGLTENGDDATVYVNTLTLSVGPESIDVPGGELRPRIGFRHQFFNYSIFGSQAAPGVVDFDSQAVYGYVRYDTHNAWQWLAGVDYVRLVDHFPNFASYKEFYREWVPRYAVTKYIHLSETRFFGLSYQGALHLTESPRDIIDIHSQDRIEQAVLVGYTHGFNPRWVVQPFYRLGYNHFTRGVDRDDFTQTLGCFLFYNVNTWFNVRAFATYDWRESDAAFVPDYRKLDVGLAAHAQWKF
jgi:hypothetical protein